MKFGMFIGRCQPFHKGHIEIINEILLNGRTPIVVLGSSNQHRNMNKNPLTYAQRKELIRLVFPNINILFIRAIDYDSWDKWYDELIENVTNSIDNEFDYHNFSHLDLSLYSHNKEVDRQSFQFNSIQFNNTFYSDIFKHMGFNIKQIKFVSRTDVVIDANARDIRTDLEGRKHLLDSRVYFKLKQWGWK